MTWSWSADGAGRAEQDTRNLSGDMGGSSGPGPGGYGGGWGIDQMLTFCENVTDVTNFFVFWLRQELKKC